MTRIVVFTIAAVLLWGCTSRCPETWFYCVPLLVEVDDAIVTMQECIPRCGRMPRMPEQSKDVPTS